MQRHLLQRLILFPWPLCTLSILPKACHVIVRHTQAGKGIHAIYALTLKNQHPVWSVVPMLCEMVCSNGVEQCCVKWGGNKWVHCNAIILFAPGMLQARMQHTSYSARYDNLFCIIVNDILHNFLLLHTDGSGILHADGSVQLSSPSSPLLLCRIRQGTSSSSSSPPPPWQCCWWRTSPWSTRRSL